MSETHHVDSNKKESGSGSEGGMLGKVLFDVAGGYAEKIITPPTEKFIELPQKLGTSFGPGFDEGGESGGGGGGHH